MSGNSDICSSGYEICTNLFVYPLHGLICDTLVNDVICLSVFLLGLMGDSMLQCTGSNGSTIFTGIVPGNYRLRIIASAPGYNESVIRRRVVVPDGSNFCTVNFIDEGAVVRESTLTVHFRGVGPVTGFQCVMDRQKEFSCEL